MQPSCYIVLLSYNHCGRIRDLLLGSNLPVGHVAASFARMANKMDTDPNGILKNERERATVFMRAGIAKDPFFDADEKFVEFIKLGDNDLDLWVLTPDGSICAALGLLRSDGPDSIGMGRHF